VGDVDAFVTISEEEEEQAGSKLPPLEIKAEIEEYTYGRFAIGPLERGFGITIGNPLRRVLLSSVPGAAVTWVRFEGVHHQYSTIPHVKEEVLEILQRVKSIRLRPLSDRPGRMRLDVSGPGDVYAGDITLGMDFEIVNPELHLATLDSSEGKLMAEFNVEQGSGYTPAESSGGLPIGTMPVDAIFSPVRRVNYAVERTRVGQVTDYERLNLEVWTDGTITPSDAVRQAARILVDHFNLVTSMGVDLEGVGAVSSVAAFIPPDVYNLLVERLELSSRTVNCLKRAGIHKVGEILERTQADLLKLRNFGDKSLEELIARLQEKSLPIPEGAGEEDQWPADGESDGEAEAELEADETEEE
jgi:DNA-directed RNA polymerase subunit alpha